MQTNLDTNRCYSYKIGRLKGPDSRGKKKLCLFDIPINRFDKRSLYTVFLNQ